jgi:aminoglycoside/choline kinase family phosphotransferase
VASKPAPPACPWSSDFGEFWRQLEWTGLQRHLRILGVFCRLKHRDGKPAYAQELPRFFGYATQVALRYRPLAPAAAICWSRCRARRSRPATPSSVASRNPAPRS